MKGRRKVSGGGWGIGGEGEGRRKGEKRGCA